MNVIVVCPCCASPVDVEVLEEWEQHLECVACGQTWKMFIDLDRIEEHALT